MTQFEQIPEAVTITQELTHSLTPEQLKQHKQQGRIIEKTKQVRYILTILAIINIYSSQALRSYFRWHLPAAKGLKKKRAAATSNATIFGGARTKRRQHQEIEIYSKMYYTERVLPVVQERVLRDNHKGPQISLIREVTRELYDKESPETITAVTTALAAAKVCDLDGDDGTSGLMRTPEQYQRQVVMFIVQRTQLTVQ